MAYLKAAQRAVSQRSSRTGNSCSQSQIVSANVARTEIQPSANVSQASRAPIMINGVAYTLVQTPTTAPIRYSPHPHTNNDTALCALTDFALVTTLVIAH